MNSRLRPFLALLAALLLVLDCAGAAPAKKPDSATAAAIKKITDRYTRTKERISVLLDQRLNPPPLPASPPNPFYHPTAIPTPDTGPEPGDVVAVPAAPDISDADTLAKFAASLKISGVVVLAGQPHLTINQSLCKTGDVIPAGTKDHPVYIQVLGITPDELTLGLNDARQKVRVKH